MKKYAVWFPALAMIGFITAGASDPIVLGDGSISVKAPMSASEDCTGELWVRHDGSFEGGGAWNTNYNGGATPADCFSAMDYDGAFCQGFTFDGEKVVTCVQISLVTLAGLFTGQPMDLYVWENGVSDMPGAVIGCVFGEVPYDVPEWPGVGVNDFEMGCIVVDTEACCGYVGQYENNYGYFCLIDRNGWPSYTSWTYSPGEGWIDPSMISAWTPVNSWGIGIWLDEGGSPVESATWGSIKGLFQ